MSYRRIHVVTTTTTPVHASAAGEVAELLGHLDTRITAWGPGAVELQRGNATLRFERDDSEQMKGEFDLLLGMVSRRSDLAAPGVHIPVHTA